MTEPRRPSRILIGGIAGWYCAVTGLRYAGLLEAQPGSVPTALLLAATLPIALVLVGHAVHRPSRDFVQSLDVGWLTLLQTWRIGGFCFLPLYEHGVLPGLFALPAGLGDAAVGLTAPLLYYLLLHRPSFRTSPWFLGWHVFGLLDLAVALSANAVTSGAFAALVTGPVTSTPTTTGMLSVIPSFFVPLLASCHVIVLLQLARRTPPVAWVRGAR